MKIEIELRTGSPSKEFITKADIQQNIDAIDRVSKKVTVSDFILLMDTKSILRGIQNKLPG